MKKACLALVASAAVWVVFALPGTAQAASAGPVHAQVRPAFTDNWVDNAAAPEGIAASTSALLVLLKASVRETLSELRVIADLSGSHAASQSANR